MPFLKLHTLFANADTPFGYDVLDGGNIHPDHVKFYPVQPGDRVVMATDGYPKLFDSLDETEKYLKEALEKDPTCTGLLCRTKGIEKESHSYDDRAYIGFTVEG